MTKYPQVHVKEKYQEFLKKLTGVGKPSAVDKQYIQKLGYKSSYDQNFVSALKFVGLVEDKRGGAPTERWNDLRSNFAGTLALGLQDGYSDLFGFYPDAHLRDDEALTSYFRGNSDGSKDEVERMVTAFNAVKELADFSDQAASTGSESVGKRENVLNGSEPISPGGGTTIHREADVNGRISGGPTININIQLQLPPDATGEVYEKIFDAMKSKLFPDR